MVTLCCHTLDGVHFLCLQLSMGEVNTDYIYPLWNSNQKKHELSRKRSQRARFLMSNTYISEYLRF